MDKLLFIDDEEGIRRSVVRALKNEPYETYTAENGDLGIAFVKKNLYEIATVISDYKMPGLNGLETLSEIGSMNPGNHSNHPHRIYDHGGGDSGDQ